MTSVKDNVLQVKYCGSKESLIMGRLALLDRKILFEYSSDFLDSGLELSPFKLPLKAGVLVCEDQIFEGLFGVFNDSLPDGWGKLLLDRKLSNSGINPSAMTPIDRLRYVGTHGMGALRYEPEFPQTSTIEKEIELDAIADESIQFLSLDQDQFIDELLIMNGSSAGARPKILVHIDPKTNQLSMTPNAPSNNDWIIKFRSSTDPKDIGPVEYAYHLMAEDAGLIVPEAKLFKSQICAGYFGVKRFDRNEHTFIHVHSLSGLLHADHRIPSLDYEAVLKATYILTKNLAETEKQFRNIVFNVFSHNRDDHAKNFSFIMDEQGVWSISPAYDLTFSAGPGGEHCTTLLGNGRNPGTQDLLILAAISHLNKQRALSIIEQVKEAVLKWGLHAERANVSPQSTKNIQTQLAKIK